MLSVGNYPKNTVSVTLKLFNFLVLEQGLASHPLVGSLTLADNVDLESLRLVNTASLYLLKPRVFRPGLLTVSRRFRANNFRRNTNCCFSGRNIG
jgi:hypothetical protein